jgi:hypothetical protein
MPLPNFTLPIASDDSDHKLISDISEFGWHVCHILADEEHGHPGYSFTVGLYYTFGHSEFLIMGLSHQASHQVFNTAVNAISNGSIFHTRDTTDTLFESYSCRFSEIKVERHKEYMGYAIWFYRSLKKPFPALQILWPDKSGKFSGEDGYDSRFDRLQTKI